VNDGRRVRLLYDQQNPFFHQGLNVVEAVSYTCAEFQHHGPLTGEHLTGVDALLVLTRLNFPNSPARKAELYQRHFTPRQRYREALQAKHERLEGMWLAVHLRTKVSPA